MNLTVKWIITLCWICIFRCAGYSTEPLFAKADSLKALGKLELAAVEYERCTFLSADGLVRAAALLSKADCYTLQHNYKQASMILLRLNYAGLPDSLAALARYRTALCFYLDGEFESAAAQLQQAEYFIADERLKYNLFFLQILVLNEQANWTKAKEKYLLWISKNDRLTVSQIDSLTRTVEALYQAENLPKLKNVEKAARLSTFLPGTGHLYAGYFWEGAANVAFQLAGLGFAAYNIYTGYYVTGAVIGLGFFQRFYGGGIKRAEFLANKKNYLRTRKFNEQVKLQVLTLQRQQ
jgi:hypothetical protein